MADKWPRHEVLASKRAALDYEDLTESRATLARQCVLDYFGVALAGAGDDARPDTAGRDVGGRRRAAGERHRHTARLPAYRRRSSMARRRMRSITMMSTWRCRAILRSRSCLALLALAELRHSSGREVITAFVAGYETACRIGAALQPGHYNLGFHSTGTVGSFGAAAACARLLGLDAEATAMALGIAGTQAAGLKSQFGTMCKPFHAGKAAQNGLLAARLAARGFSSRADIVECVQGFALTHGPDFSPEAALRDARSRAAPLRQPLQIPCRLLPDACADRMRPPAARASTG